MTDSNPLDGNAVIVTGATQEPGRTLVAALAGAGANVAAVDDSQEELQTLAVEIAGRGTPGRVLAMAAELPQPGLCRRVVSRAALAFTELVGLVVDVRNLEDPAPPAGPEARHPFWDYAPDPPTADDILLALAAPAVRQCQAHGWGRLVVVAGAEAPAPLRFRLAEWAGELDGTSVTATLLRADDADPDRIAAALRWLMSADADGFNGKCLNAAQWDPALDPADAATAAASPVA